MYDTTEIPSWPERRARVTTSKAELGEFRRECTAFNERGLTVDWLAWAYRLSHSVEMLLPCVNLTEDPA